MSELQRLGACETWLWVELIGFDNEQADFGVGEYLARAGFVPDAVSLFVFSPDFVHTHDGVAQDRVFPFDYSTYGGHPCSYERDRQDWTRFQLLGLIRELQARGIAVYFSVFDIFVTSEWIGGHPELLHVTADGQRTGSICPWKRLAGGSYYEDFYAAQAARVIADYGFDGYHQADGYCHPRFTLYQADFSDDMTDQFLAATGLALPPGLNGFSGDDPDVIARRAAHIWRHLRREWMAFYGRRTARFCRKVAEAVHAAGGKVVLNQALTREPMQALYRYGIDYRAIADAGADGWVLETVAPGVTLGGEGGTVASPHYDFLAMTLLMKARLPEVPLRCLNNAHDVNEQWDVLRHGPMLLEREILCNANLYLWTRDGLRRCSEGPVVCLADGIQAHEWAWLRQWWGLGFGEAPRRLLGATVLWSDSAFEPQMADYLASRRPTVHKLLYDLMAHGAPIYAVARVEDLAAVDGPLLVLNPHLLPEEELAAALAYDRGPVVTIGGRPASLPPSLPAADAEFEDVHGPDAQWCGVWRALGAIRVAIPPDEPEVLADDFAAIGDPLPYFQELYYRKVSEGFLAACARVLAECAGAPRVLHRPDVIRAQAMEMSDGRLSLLIGNDSFYYVPTQVDVGRPVQTARVVTAFPGSPPWVAGSTVGVRVPGRGIVALDLILSPSAKGDTAS